MATTLHQVAAVAGGKLDRGSRDDAESLVVDAISINAQGASATGMFAAVPGTRTHGAKFAETSKAAAILTDEEGAAIIRAAGDTRPIVIADDLGAILGEVSATIYDYPSRRLNVIGVTGTSGKTTVAYLLEAGLMACGLKVGLIGTNGTRIAGVPVASELTTPQAPALQELFAHMLERGVTHVVMEVSSHALALGRVAGTHFTVGGFTNLSQDHLDFHKTMDNYFRAKAMFFHPGSPVAAANKVICVDGAWGKKMAVWAGPAAVTVSTRNEPALVEVSSVTRSPDAHQHFSVSLPGCPRLTVPVALALPGRFNVANAALAIAMAQQAGVDPATVAGALSDVVVPGRMQPISLGQDFAAIIDYAHKPGALNAVLSEVKEHTSGRLACVVGCGGDRDHGKRQKMGHIAASMCDLVVITDDNPRSEDPAAIRASILEGATANDLTSPARVVEIGDRQAAIDYAVDWARSGDAIVVAGKGHEKGQRIGDVVHHFDDVEATSHAISARLAAHDNPSQHQG